VEFDKLKVFSQLVLSSAMITYAYMAARTCVCVYARIRLRGSSVEESRCRWWIHLSRQRE